MATYFLLIDTSGDGYSVAVASEEQVLASIIQSDKSMLPSHLTIDIKQLLQDAAVELAELAAIAITAGPGSYTGLRIGYATAKGLAFGLSIPLITLPATDILVSKVLHSPLAEMSEASVIVPAILMRANEIYTGTYDPKGIIIVSPDFVIFPLSDPEHPLLTQTHMLTCGNGSHLIETLERPQTQYSHPHFDARDLWWLAKERFEKRQFDDVVTCEPLYIKAPNITVSKKELLR